MTKSFSHFSKGFFSKGDQKEHHFTELCTLPTKKCLKQALNHVLYTLNAILVFFELLPSKTIGFMLIFKCLLYCLVLPLSAKLDFRQQFCTFVSFRKIFLLSNLLEEKIELACFSTNTRSDYNWLYKITPLCVGTKLPIKLHLSCCLAPFSQVGLFFN